MIYLIKKMNNKFYIFEQNRFGNLFDTMHNFKTLDKARFFISFLKESEL